MSTYEIYRIILPYACAGIIIKNGIIIKTAPIFNWMQGRTIEQIKSWVYNKKGNIQKIERNGS